MQALKRARAWSARLMVRPQMIDVTPTVVEPEPGPEPERILLGAVDDKGNYIDPVWPEDRHAVPAWRLQQEAWAAAGGYTLPNIRTRADYETALELCEISAAAPQVACHAPAPPWPADLAAIRFVVWLRDPERCGPGYYSSAELEERYKEFCMEMNRKPSALNLVRRAMARIDGVAKTRPHTSDGSRPNLWLIEAADAVPQRARDLKLAA